MLATVGYLLLDFSIVALMLLIGVLAAVYSAKKKKAKKNGGARPILSYRKMGNNEEPEDDRVE